MAVQAADVVKVLSGGPSNADPSLSLGGSPSGVPLGGGINNLFDNESLEDSTNGRTDYRCFYVFNDNTNDVFFDVNLWIDSQVDGGASIKIGINLISDSQLVSILGQPDAGTLTLTYNGDDVVLDASLESASLSAQLQTQLRLLPGASGVTVTTTAPAPDTIGLAVTFVAGRYQPILVMKENSLTGDGSLDVVITKTANGSPINTIASPISSSITTPNGITFTSPTSSSPISLGDMRPLDGFPVWVQRVCLAGAIGVPNDGATIRITGKPFSSA